MDSAGKFLKFDKFQLFIKHKFGPGISPLQVYLLSPSQRLCSRGARLFICLMARTFFVLYILAGTQRNSYFVAAILSVFYIIAVINIQQRLGKLNNVLLVLY